MNLWQTLPKPFSVLAPMEDVTDSAFRRLILHCGAPDVLFTEFTSVDGICSAGFKGVKHRLLYHPEELKKPLIAQIWGNTPENYLKTAQLLADMGFSGIDINMGCPVPKVTKKGCCSALIENPALASELFLAAKEGAPHLPISIKTRIGFRTKVHLKWCQFLLDLSPAALIIHGRVAKHMSKYPADWQAIGEVVELRDSMKSDTVIVGNGDVESHSQIEEYSKTYGVDGVMVGRGIFKNPFLFDKSLPSSFMQTLPARKKLEILLLHASLFSETWKGRKPYAVLKKYLKIYVSNFTGASELRNDLMQTNSIEEMKLHIKDWLNSSSVYSESVVS